MKKVERFLNDMSSQGYYLTKVSFNYFFHFEKRNTKGISYLVSYREPRGEGLGDLEASVWLKDKNSFVKREGTAYTFYYITKQIHKMETAAENLRKHRNDYIEKVLCKRIALMILVATACILGLCNAAPSESIWPVFWIWLGIDVIALIYSFVGLFRL